MLKKVEYLMQISKLNVANSCQDLKDHGVTLSGNYNIDYDQNHNGLAPIEVFCNFEKNTTEIGHDQESQVTIETCSHENCLDLNITYNVNMEQIQNLISQSLKCYQDITFNCKKAPLKLNDISFARWFSKNSKLFIIYFLTVKNGP